MDLKDEFLGDIVTSESRKKERRPDSVYDHNVICMAIFLCILLIVMLFGCKKFTGGLPTSYPVPDVPVPRIHVL